MEGCVRVCWNSYSFKNLTLAIFKLHFLISIFFWAKNEWMMNYLKHMKQKLLLRHIVI